MIVKKVERKILNLYILLEFFSKKKMEVEELQSTPESVAQFVFGIRELLLEICRHMTGLTYLNFAMTCRTLHSIVPEPTLPPLEIRYLRVHVDSRTSLLCNKYVVPAGCYIHCSARDHGFRLRGELNNNHRPVGEWSCEVAAKQTGIKLTWDLMWSVKYDEKVDSPKSIKYRVLDGLKFHYENRQCTPPEKCAYSACLKSHPTMVHGPQLETPTGILEVGAPMFVKPTPFIIVRLGLGLNNYFCMPGFTIL